MNDAVAPDETRIKDRRRTLETRQGCERRSREAKKALNDENDKATHEAKLKERREMLERRIKSPTRARNACLVAAL